MEVPRVHTVATQLISAEFPRSALISVLQRVQVSLRMCVLLRGQHSQSVGRQNPAQVSNVVCKTLGLPFDFNQCLAYKREVLLNLPQRYR
jgi:hypothetical protein